MAGSRAQFLGLLRGRLITDFPDDLSTIELFERVRSRTENFGEIGPDPLIEKQVGEIAGDRAVDVLRAYYDTLRIYERANPGGTISAQTLNARFVPGVLRNAQSFRAAFLFHSYYLQYVFPAEARAHIGNRSFLFNERKYRQLRQLFVEDRVAFAVGHVRSQPLYAAAARLLTERGWSTVAVTTSNIFDWYYKEFNWDTRNEFYRAYAGETCRSLLGGGVRAPIYFRQTRGLEEHSFEHYRMSKPEDAGRIAFRAPRRARNAENLILSLLNQLVR